MDINIMIKMIIFDLDGVLIDAKKMHYDTLNSAIKLIAGDEYIITWEDHINTYDGLKTRQKLDMLVSNKNMSSNFIEDIWNIKQKLTLEYLDTLKVDINIEDVIKKLVDDGFKIACCSNSVRKTVNLVLSKMNIIKYFDLILSNEDVMNSKPHSEIYWKAMIKSNLMPKDVLILEDSPNGLYAAYNSNANVLRVDDSKSVTYENIINEIEYINKNKKITMNKWSNKKMNVLIPMAGAGSRFEKAGYELPKPLIDVNGKPMIKLVVDNLNIDANYIFVVQKSHVEKYNLKVILNIISPNCKIVEVDSLTEGAACTALLAKEYINNDNPLFFANSDQFVEWDSNEFLYKLQDEQIDGGIVTFNANDSKWSYAKIGEDGFVNEVAEKNPISNLATVGYYYWKRGSDFVKYSEEMIKLNIRVNNEFYVCPVFNQAIKNGSKIITYNANKMWGLGTPEDLQLYLKNYNN